MNIKFKTLTSRGEGCFCGVVLKFFGGSVCTGEMEEGLQVVLGGVQVWLKTQVLYPFQMVIIYMGLFSQVRSQGDTGVGCRGGFKGPPYFCRNRGMPPPLFLQKPVHWLCKLCVGTQALLLFFLKSVSAPLENSRICLWDAPSSKSAITSTFSYKIGQQKFSF